MKATDTWPQNLTASLCFSLKKMLCELLAKWDNCALSISIIFFAFYFRYSKTGSNEISAGFGWKNTWFDYAYWYTHLHPYNVKTAPACLFTRHPLVLYIECPSISSICLQRKIMQPSFLNTHSSSSLKTSAFDKYRQSFYLKYVKQNVFKSERGPITDSCGTPNVPLHPMVRTAVSEGLPAWKSVYVFFQWIEHPADLKFQSAVNSLTSEHKIRHII